MRTSVIILNYNGRRWLRRCVSAVLQQEGAFEIVVVDNASSDGSIEEIRSLPRVDVSDAADHANARRIVDQLNLITLRYGSADVRGRACEVAAQIAAVLRARGWSGTVTGCPRCRKPPDRQAVS